MKNQNAPIASLDTYIFENLPLLGTTTAGQQIWLGGFSGLWFEGHNEETGALQFVTHPDRGPNLDPVDTDGDGIKERPFALPTFQARLVYFELHPVTGVLTITKQLFLTRADGTPISGLPNFVAKTGFDPSDELAIDLYDDSLATDSYGADLEGIVQTEDGSYWLADEYRPSIYHFHRNGILIERYVPQGSNASGVEVGVEAIPAIYARRHANRGFEAIAYENGILYAFLQSPLPKPYRTRDEKSKASKFARILAFDTATATPVAEYLYEFTSPTRKRISDAVALGNGEFLAIESDEAIGPQAQKFIYRINLAGATNLLGRDEVPAGQKGQHEPASVDVVPVEKRFYVDLGAIGYVYGAKIEGLALIDENTLAVINDNDFGVSGIFDPTTGLMKESETPTKSVLGIIHLHPRA